MSMLEQVVSALGSGVEKGDGQSLAALGGIFGVLVGAMLMPVLEALAHELAMIFRAVLKYAAEELVRIVARSILAKFEPLVALRNLLWKLTDLTLKELAKELAKLTVKGSLAVLGIDTVLLASAIMRRLIELIATAVRVVGQ